MRNTSKVKVRKIQFAARGSPQGAVESPSKGEQRLPATESVLVLADAKKGVLRVESYPPHKDMLSSCPLAPQSITMFMELCYSRKLIQGLRELSTVLDCCCQLGKWLSQ